MGLYFREQSSTLYIIVTVGRAVEICRNKGIVYLLPVLTVPRQQRVNWLVTHKRECYGIKEIEIASCVTPTFKI